MDQFLNRRPTDLNPIENAYSKFKWLLRSEKLRDRESLWKACGRLLDKSNVAECKATSHTANAALIKSNAIQSFFTGHPKESVYRD